MTAPPPAPSPSVSPLDDLRFAVIGTGRVGTSLSLALVGAGATLVGHTARTEESRRRAADVLALPAADSVADLAAATVERVDVYLLTVPDDHIADVARSLAAALQAALPSSRALFTRRYAPIAALHTSGATSTSVLSPLADLGLLTFSFHPLQTFADPATGPERLRGASVAVTPATAGSEGDARKVLALGSRLAESVGARPFVLEERHRVIYHAAACMASNYLVTLQFLAQELFLQAGLPSAEVLPAFLPLVRGTVDNLEAEGPVGALTGPLSRGDVATIRRHVEALADEAPGTLPAYRTLGQATLQLVRIRGGLADRKASTLEDLLSEATLPTVGATSLSRRH